MKSQINFILADTTHRASKMIWTKLPVIALLLCLNFQLTAQVLFLETFSGANGTISGSANGVTWSSSCPTCLSGDWWETRSGVFEARDTNGEAEWITDTPIDVSSCDFVEISFNIQSIGTMEACGTGCNSVDWVLFQYNVDAAGWTDPSNSSFCSGACAGINVVASDDVGSITYSTGCLPMNGNGLQLRIGAQCWAADEYWRIDNITVTCSSVDPGTNGNLTICPTASPINLFDQLAGTPDNGGTWTGPSLLTGGDLGTFDPALMNSGIYTYSVGTAPCILSAEVQVTVAGANAGIDGVMSIACGPTTDDLLPYLGGNPDPGGVWTGPSPIPSNDPDGNFDPLTMLPGVYTYTVGSAPCSASANVTVTVVNANDAGIDNSIDLCVGSVSLDLFNALDGTPNTGGTWSGPSALSGGDLGTFDPATMSAGNYTYTVGIAPCAITATVSVNFAASDDPSFTYSNYCENESPVISISGTNGGSFSFNPIPMDGATIDLSTGVISNGVGGTNYTVQYTTNGICPQTSTQVITVYELPNIVTNNPNVCLGNEIEINANGALNYSWNNGLGIGQNQLVSPATSTTYTVTGTNIQGCQSSSQCVVTVLPLPIVSAGADQFICAGSSAVLNGSGANLYNWSGGILNGIPFYPMDNSTYTVTGVDLNGCQNEDSVAIFVETAPTPSFFSNNLFGCLPLTASFYSNTSGDIVNCSWNIDGNQLNGCDSVSYTFNNAGLYDITLTTESANGCIGTTTYTNYISVEEHPIASFTLLQLETTSSQSEVSFTNGSIGASSYMWSFGDNSSSFEFEPIHQYDFSDVSSYTISLVATSENGCTDSVQFTISQGESLIYYVPNAFTPDGDEFNNTFLPIFTEGFDPYDYHFSIYYRWGELIFESRNSDIGWDGTYANSYQLNDVYIWKIDFKLSNSSEHMSATGTVHLVK